MTAADRHAAEVELSILRDLGVARRPRSAAALIIAGLLASVSLGFTAAAWGFILTAHRPDVIPLTPAAWVAITITAAMVAGIAAARLVSR